MATFDPPRLFSIGKTGNHCCWNISVRKWLSFWLETPSPKQIHPKRLIEKPKNVENTRGVAAEWQRNGVAKWIF